MLGGYSFSFPSGIFSTVFIASNQKVRKNCTDFHPPSCQQITSYFSDEKGEICQFVSFPLHVLLRTFHHAGDEIFSIERYPLQKYIPALHKASDFKAM